MMSRTSWTGLDTWTLGVLVTWTVDADWGSRVLTREVPGLVAERLLGPASGLPCSPADGTADLPERDRGAGSQQDIVRPGIFDDTPVFDRRPVTLDHISALRTLAPGADQVHLVFSVSGGAEVLPLDTIERRLAKGWLGVLIAGARDLPASVIGLEEPETSPEPDVRDAQLPSRGQGVHGPHFGESLGLAEGGRRTLRQTYGTQDRDLNLRRLALVARGAHDLRRIDAKRSGGLPVAVWHGLLTEDRLNLAPFQKPGSDRWRSGSGLPLGPLARVQLYTTNANPLIEGKGHSLLCRPPMNARSWPTTTSSPSPTAWLAPTSTGAASAVATPYADSPTPSSLPLLLPSSSPIARHQRATRQRDRNSWHRRLYSDRLPGRTGGLAAGR
ncbi:hypothetical protein [Streptomyces sp. NBC_01237]|uniref:hypothetical protein n=1 Tax=Streptomyces sp. NBC_01237 TaxID=2903790 RepID=UPI002DDA02E5|nr:hypothetical protein [Streptomyces sp. NBC_01237]WRZ78353.1 hypothetical protein OG251_43130 [Streptomyces sp. NBC_01237]